MGKTIFQQENADFSDIAHTAALNQVYPKFFNRNFTCESTSMYKSKHYEFLDGKKKIDRIFKFKVDDDRVISITVQERFRRAKYYKNRDITLTEYNYSSGVGSEVYAIEAMYFVYGYYNDETGIFGEVIIVNVPSLIRKIVNNQIPFTRRINKKNQSFLCFKFDNLIKDGLVSLHIKNY